MLIPDGAARRSDAIAIAFPNGNTASAVHAGPRRTVRSLLEAIELSASAPVVVVVGGAADMDAAIAPRLEALLERGALPAAADAGAVLLDGGTEAGVMAVLGHAVAMSELPATLVGVAPEERVTYPGDERTNAGTTPLEPNHTHFILAHSGEWGGETALLFDVIDLIAEGRPAVMLVAGGGPRTIDEVAMARRRGMPIVSLAGTGGTADRLAAAAAPADGATTEPAPTTDPVAALAAEAHLLVLPADAGPDELRHLLARLLRDDETLRDTWRQHATIARTARRRQLSFRRQQKLILGLGVVLTLLVACQVVLEGATTVPWAKDAADVLRYGIIVIPILIGVLGAAMTYFRPGTQWIMLRGTAESIKSEIYRYRARAGIYSIAETRRRPRQVKLAQAVGSAMGALMRSDVNRSALEPEPHDATGVRIDVAEGDDGLAPLSPARYVRFRIEDQVEFYRQRAGARERYVRRLRWLTLLIGGLGTFLAAVELEIWVAVTVAAAAAFATYLESQQLETTVMLYNQAAADLEAIRAWWLALPPGDQLRPETIDRLVERSEEIMRAEHAGWVQQMQDAMTKFRLEGVEDDKAAPARSGGRETDVQSAKPAPSDRRPRDAETTAEAMPGDAPGHEPGHAPDEEAPDEEAPDEHPPAPVSLRRPR